MGFIRSIPSLEVEDASVLDEFIGWIMTIQTHPIVGSFMIVANEQQMTENSLYQQQPKRVGPTIYDFRRSACWQTDRGCFVRRIL